MGGFTHNKWQKNAYGADCLTCDWNSGYVIQKVDIDVTPIGQTDPVFVSYYQAELHVWDRSGGVIEEIPVEPHAFHDLDAAKAACQTDRIERIGR